ncbi:MAG TPA: PIN domain-containing protein [Solirubrobacteraceae bacterium]|nr:PIN domain-containing protein [Solirubrobacteraceae bacterium]
MAESAESRGLVDTSALVALDQIDASLLPAQVAISAISLAELAAGLHASADSLERARRLQRLQLSEASFDAMPFDGACARAYGRLYAQLLSAGRKARGRRALDLLIAATAAAAGLPLCTANPADFAGLGKAVKVTSVGARP